MKNLSLSTRFLLILLIIVVLFISILTSLLYFYLRESLIKSSFEKMQMVMGQMEALGRYVKDDLRPVLFRILRERGYKDDFILEAMSTTHVRKQVSRYFKDRFPEVDFERVSFHPINPENAFQDFHQELLRKISKDLSKGKWQGLFKWKNQEYVVIAKPIYVEKMCLICHQKLGSAPQGLVKLYHVKRDFPWKEGDLMGIELVRYPIEKAFSEIKNLAFSLFLISILSAVFLLLSLEGVFYTLILKPLKKMNQHFKSIKGSQIPLNSPLNLQRSDEIGELAGSFNELSHHLYHSQRALQENLKTLETLFESITYPIVLLNRDCEPEISNQAFQGFPYKKCQAELIYKVINEKRELKETIETEEGRIYEVSLYPVFNQEREVIKVVLTLEDITEKKKMEERFIITEKMAAVGQLSAGLAHEINNPLSGILLMLNQIKKGTLGEDEKKLYLSLIEQGLIKIQRLLRDLLNFSRATELRPEKVSINSLVENLLELSSYLLEKHKIRVIKILDPELPEITVDREKMEQVFLNILLNALQAMENSPERILTIKTSQRDKYLLISFEDTGPGVPKEIASRIFEPFFTTKPPGQGTGLGLAVSLAIVEKHGGKIYLEERAKGANFIVELPTGEVDTLARENSHSGS